MSYQADKSYRVRKTDEIEHLLELQRSFKYFFYHCAAPALYGDPERFISSRGFDVMSEYAVAWLDGDIRRLLVSIPPRNSKSQIFSEALPMFEWLTNPSRTFISVSHHSDVLEQFNSHRQGIFNNIEYQRIAGYQLITDSIGTMRNDKSGHILTMGMLNVVTGLGASRIIVDDPISAGNALNVNHCNKVAASYTGALLSRLDGKKEAGIMIVSQRLSEMDLVGRLQDVSGYESLTLQAIADEPQTILFPLSGIIWQREPGDVLSPDYESLDVLQEIRSTDPSMFTSQYQQRPQPISSKLFQQENIRRYDKPQEKYQEIILSIDSAASVSKDSAAWGMVVLGKYIVGGLTHLDLLFAHAQKYEYPAGKAKIIQLACDYNVDTLMVENRSTGLALIPELKGLGYSVIAIEAIKSKQDRLLSSSSFINQGRFGVPDQDKLPFVDAWLSYFLYELFSFPGGKSCDLVDSLSQAVIFYGNRNFNARAFFRLG